jgi:hypothetical protein
MFSKTIKIWEAEIGWSEVAIWAFFVSIFIFGLNHNLPIWGRVLMGVCVSTIVVMTVISESRKYLAKKLAIVWGIIGILLICISSLYVISRPPIYWDLPLLIVGIITLTGGIGLSFERFSL